MPQFIRLKTNRNPPVLFLASLDAQPRPSRVQHLSGFPLPTTNHHQKKVRAQLFERRDGPVPFRQLLKRLRSEKNKTKRERKRQKEKHRIPSN